MKLNENIRNFRLFRGITQSELAAHLGKSKNVISNWERGDNSPSPDEVEKLCQILNVTPNQIFGWEQMPEYNRYLEQQRVQMVKINGIKRKQELLMKELGELNRQLSAEKQRLNNIMNEEE